MIKFIKKSKNRKTGAIPQTYMDKSTCPKRCPWRGHGCYGENFTTNLTWNRVYDPLESIKDSVKELKGKCVIRQSVAGDIATPNTNDIDRHTVDILNDAYKGHFAYTYTHCELSPINVKIAKASKMVINFSCETLSQVKKCKKYGVPSVLSVRKMEGEEKTIDGIKFKKCPAIYKEGMNCKKCLKCLNKNRNYVIVFEVHGKGQKKADFLIKDL